MVDFLQDAGSVVATGGATEVALAVGGLERVDQLALTQSHEVVAVTVSQGKASVALDLTLPARALVRRFDVRVGALRADQALAGEVGEVRGQVVDGQLHVVIDFGVLRTVSRAGVLVPIASANPPSIATIHAWNGVAFGVSLIDPDAARNSSTKTTHVSFAEVQTERLLIVFDGSLDEDELGSLIYLVLPQPPADLELTLDGGPPVWTFAGAVKPGASNELTRETWNDEGQLLVSLAAGLAASDGDVAATGERTVRAVLSARVPGVLSLVEVEREVLYVERAALGGKTSRDLTFASEDRRQLVLDLPPVARSLAEVRFVGHSEVEAERVVEPTGPAAVDAAELVVDPDHAFGVRLAAASGLGELTGIRLPLTAAAAGAEARVVLWQAADGAHPEPVTALPMGTSEPVALDAASSDGEAPWITFPFAEPVLLPEPDDSGGETPALWAMLIVNRGEVVWGLIESSGDDDPLAVHEIRRGAPAGPWQKLPELFAADGVLGHLRGRVRVVGRPSEEAPLAPWIIGLAKGDEAVSSTVETRPDEDGQVTTLTLASAIDAEEEDTLSLVITSRAIGKLTLEEVDVVWRPPAAKS